MGEGLRPGRARKPREESDLGPVTETVLATIDRTRQGHRRQEMRICLCVAEHAANGPASWISFREFYEDRETSEMKPGRGITVRRGELVAAGQALRRGGEALGVVPPRRTP